MSKSKMLRFLALIGIDVVLINLAFLCALAIRFEGFSTIPVFYLDNYAKLFLVFTSIRIFFFYVFGLYNRVWQYASIGELIAVSGAVTMGSVGIIAYSFFMLGVGKLPFPKSVLLLSWMLNIMMIGSSRLSLRIWRSRAVQKYPENRLGKQVLIVGAGDTGVLVAKELQRHNEGNLHILGFVDDDLGKKGMKILGLPVLGDCSTVVHLLEKYPIHEVVMAIPSAEKQLISSLLEVCTKSRTKLKILPGVYHLIEGKGALHSIREVEVEDLLGREPINLDIKSICHYLLGQVVLVTGGGGSIGGELCRQVVRFQPKMLVIMDNCENNVYDIEMELRRDYPHLELVALVKDVRDKRAVEQVFSWYKPRVVFHAAAHKHVPLMEVNPEEAVKNNVFGTYQVAWAAHRYGADKFVLISTDKAVNPTSIMGATKRLAEMIIQHLDRQSETNFVAVRFGNVLASRGSVVPLFKQQIAAGGPVTVTHPEMVRYFMTIPEAVQLVIQAGSMAKGGEIFVLDMGDPVKIMDLAQTLIKLSGFIPDVDIEIIITGMRPGEKLYEELLTAEEGVNVTSHQRIFAAKPNGLQDELLDEMMARMMHGWMPDNQGETVQLIQKFLPDFRLVENKPVAVVAKVKKPLSAEVG